MGYGSQPLENLQDIRRIMQRSSRFISLSGLSGIAVGTCALAGTFIAQTWIVDYYLWFCRVVEK